MLKTWVFLPSFDKSLFWGLVLALGLCVPVHATTRLTLSPPQPASPAPMVISVPLTTPQLPVAVYASPASQPPKAQSSAAKVVQKVASRFQAFQSQRGLAKTLNQQLQADPFVAQSHLKVQVQPQRVVLTGGAYSPLQVAKAQQLLASQLEGRTFHDQSVLLNHLPPDPETTSPRKVQVADTKNETFLKLRLLRAGLLRGTDIQVNSMEGVVVLEGSVNSQRQKERAEFYAQTMPGVSQVINRLAER